MVDTETLKAVLALLGMAAFLVWGVRYLFVHGRERRRERLRNPPIPPAPPKHDYVREARLAAKREAESDFVANLFVFVVLVGGGLLLLYGLVRFVKWAWMN